MLTKVLGLMMMATRTVAGAGVRSVAVLAAGAVAAGVLGVVGAVAPASAAGTQAGGQAGVTAEVVASQKAQKAKKAKKGKRGKGGSLKAAKRAEKKARVRVEALEEQVTSARTAAVGPTNAYNAAVRDETTAKGAAAENAKKVERGKYLLANQDALYFEWMARAKPFADAEKAAKDAVTAAEGVVTSLNGQVSSLQTDINAAYNSSQAVFNEINDLQYNQIPTVQGQYNTAWADEQSAFATKETYREDLARRKAQWYDCRITNGRYECKSSAGASWQWVPKLDEVSALLDQWQATYNQNKNRRQDVEAYLGQLNAVLAARQADHANIANLINGLTSQKAAVQAKIPAAQAAVTAARTVYDGKRQALEAMFKEWDSILAEINAAKSGLPSWEATQAGLNAKAAEASAKVAAAAPEYTATSAKVAEVNEALVKARKALKAAVAKVKKIRKGRGRG